MSRLKRYFGSFRILAFRKRRIAAYLLFVLATGGSLLYIYAVKSSEIAREELTQSALQTMKQAEINISYKLNSISNASDMLIANPNVYENLAVEADRPASFSQVRAFKELQAIVDSAQNNREVYGVRLFVRPALQYARENIRFFPLTAIQEKPWYDAVIAQNGAIYWSAPYAERFAERPDAMVVSAARMLRNPKNYDELLGVLVIDAEETQLLDMLYSIRLAEKQTVCLVDARGVIISHTDRRLLGQRLLPEDMQAEMDGRDEGLLKLSGPGDPLTLYRTVPLTGWKLIVQIPAAEISAKSAALNRISGLIAILFAFFLFLLALSFVFAFMAENMTFRIKRLIDTMRREGLEDAKMRVVQKQGNLFMLEESIAHMIGTVKTLAEQSMQAKIHEKEAMLKALQAQINPHFLYNTLEAVNWMAVRRGAGDISTMMDALSKYFRLTLNQGKDIVRVEDELNLARAYLYIQSVRFAGQFETVFDIAPGVDDCRIPKLTLQPVIENALMHGIQNRREGPGLLTIRAVRDGPLLRFTVTDNGVGIPPERLARMLQPPQEGQTGGYGLYNVYERIKLFSGEDGSVAIASEEGAGTQVTITIAAVPYGP